MLKKFLSWGLAAYLALSPLSAVNVQDTIRLEQKVDNHKTRYVRTKYKGATIHLFIANPKKHDIKVSSSVCSYLSDLKNGEPKIKIFSPKGKTLCKIVAEHEMKSNKNVMGALNGSYFDTKNYYAVGRGVVNERRIKRKIRKKKSYSKKKFSYNKFPDYDFKFRASFYVNKNGVPTIGYYKNISDSKYFLTAGSMLVQNNVNIWKKAFQNEMFDKGYLKPYKRGAVAITEKGNVLFVATSEMTLDTLTDFLMKIEVRDAMSVDSGSSVQLLLDKSFNKGKEKDYLIYGTQRKIVNGIIVVEK